jgi:hypothetical protein
VGNVARSNCVFGAALGAVGSTTGWAGEALVTADPRFVDRAAGDYRLASDSPCLRAVGYDTARLMADEPTAPATAAEPAPTPEPAPAEAPVPASDPAPAPVNAPPTVQLTSPVPGATAGLPLRMAADAADDHGVTKVQFFVDGKLVKEDTTAPFATRVTLPKRLRKGWHTATAEAHDADGLVALSDGVPFRTG